MSKNKIIKILFFTIIFYICMVAGTKVKATPLSISVSTSNATVGDSVKITITSEYTGRVNISTSGGNLSESRVWVENNSQTVTLTSDSEETINITASAEGGMLSNNGVDVSVGDQGASVTFSKKQTEEPETPPAKSDNANLKNLGIRPNDFTGFKSGTTSYDVKVPNSVDKVEVYAVKADEKATVTGTGNKSLNVGKNVLTVEVTAEDGTKKTYTINVTREEKTEETNETSNEITNEVSNEIAENTTVGETTTVDSDLTKLEVKGYTMTPNFSPNIYEYKLNLTDTNVTELEVITQGANEDVKIEVVGNTELKDGENIITVLVTNNKTKENNTYQIIVNKGAINLDEIDAALSKNIEKVNMIRGIILGIIALIVLSEIIFVILCYRKRKQMKEQEFEDDKYSYESDDNEDYTRHIFDKDKNGLKEIDDNKDIEENTNTLYDGMAKGTTQDEVRKIMNDAEEIDETSISSDKNEVNEKNIENINNENTEKERTYGNFDNYDQDDNGYRRNRGKGKHF